LNFFNLVFVFNLIGLENYTGNSFFFYFNLILLLFFIFDNRMKKKYLITNIPTLYYVLLFLIVIGAIRNNLPTTDYLYVFQNLLKLILILLAFYYEFSKKISEGKKPYNIFFNIFYQPLFFLLIINFLGFILNLIPNNYSEINLGKSVSLAFFGIDKDRANFPFTPGFNSYGVISGVVFLFSLLGVSFDKQNRKKLILGLAVSALSLLLVDTRSVILFSFLLFFIYLYKSYFSKTPKLFWLIPLIGIIGPFLVSIIILFFSDIIDFSSLQRSKEDLTSFNGRNFIWFQSTLEFISFKVTHIFGYGDYGHYKSGVSEKWAYIFGNFGDKASFTSPHSFLLSVLFDYGYIGLFFYLYYQYKILILIKNNWFKNLKLNILLVNFIFYWNLIGITETTHGFYNTVFLYIYLLIGLFTFKLYYKRVDSE
jgi:hypothetical protein